MKFEEIKECISFIESQHRTGTKSLEHMKMLCEIFHHPEKSFKSIHVAGTNGKGSVVSYLKSILKEAGYKVGTFTSPYIECFNERITFDGQFIKDEEILSISNQILMQYPLLEEKNIEKPSFFEFVTLMCFLYFEKTKPDIAIIEVGIGGLLDSTNLITPILSIISNVDFDHMNILGNTIEEIASNKLGIVKEGIPLVTLYDERIHGLIQQTCMNQHSKCYYVKKENIKIIQADIEKTVFNYHEYQQVSLNMLGKHQAENASIVLEACNVLKQTYSLSKDSIYRGLKNTFWPGRLEKIRTKPCILLDGAHNPNGIHRLHEFIKSLNQHPTHLVVAISSNKDKEPMIHEIEQDVDEIIFTQFLYKRSDEASHLYQYSHHPNKRLEYDYQKILDEARNDLNPNSLWVFCGSLYFVSEIRKVYQVKG